MTRVLVLFSFGFLLLGCAPRAPVSPHVAQKVALRAVKVKYEGRPGLASPRYRILKTEPAGHGWCVRIRPYVDEPVPLPAEHIVTVDPHGCVASHERVLRYPEHVPEPVAEAAAGTALGDEAPGK